MDIWTEVTLFVLNGISDDYENVDQTILRAVVEISAGYGLTVERPDVVASLAELIEEGLAKAYLLPCREPYTTEIQGMPSLNVIDDVFKTYRL